jgi:hypothetical protein
MIWSGFSGRKTGVFAELKTRIKKAESGDMSVRGRYMQWGELQILHRVTSPEPVN